MARFSLFVNSTLKLDTAQYPSWRSSMAISDSKASIVLPSHASNREADPTCPAELSRVVRAEGFEEQLHRLDLAPIELVVQRRQFAVQFNIVEQHATFDRIRGFLCRCRYPSNTQR